MTRRTGPACGNNPNHPLTDRDRQALAAFRAFLDRRAADRAKPDLTAEEARDLANDLALQLYRAQDALAFVEECCAIADREQQQVTTTDVREWLKGARCGRQLLAAPPALDAPSEPVMAGQDAVAPRTECAHWVDIANALNAAHAAGMAVGIACTECGRPILPNPKRPGRTVHARCEPTTTHQTERHSA